MTVDFVQVLIETDPVAITDTAIDQVNNTLAANGFPGWTANDASLAVIIIQTIAQIAADIAQIAATAVPAIFRAFGTQLLNVAYQHGTQANVTSTWTFTSPAPTGGYLIPSGTSVVIDGVGFYVQSDLQTGTGATTAQITLIASQPGTAANQLGAIGEQAQLVNSIDWVATVVLQGQTTGGVNQEDDTSYQNRLATVLTLMTPRPITANDYATIVQSDLAGNAAGVTAGRATSIDGYYPDGRYLSSGGATTPTALSCRTTSGSAQVTVNSPSGTQVPTVGATVTGTGVPAGTFTANTATGSPVIQSVSSFTSCGVGTLVTGTNIPVGAQIIAVDTGAGTATMSGNATNTATGVTVTPQQTVLATPSATEATFSISVNATATSSAVTLTVSQLSGYGPSHLSANVNTTTGSATVAIIAPPYTGAIPDIGARVRGAGIPAGSTVLAVPAPSTAAFTISANASATATNVPVTISSWTSTPRSVTTFVTDSQGNALTTAQMDALQTWLLSMRELNFFAFLMSPSYTPIFVSTQIRVLPGYSSTAVVANVQGAVVSYLSPATWGNPSAVTNGAVQWFSSTSGFNVVRLNALIGVIENVPGVQYVPAGGITLGTTVAPVGITDVTLSGPAPLPTTLPANIVVTSV